MSAYKVILEPVEDGYWLATVPAVQGCLTQGRNLKNAKKRIREALSLFVNDAKKAELDFEIRFPEAFSKKRVHA